ncbi:unnamed protein product (macronuclear) [Paramecium tetraurelia]|uniref:P-loop containing nucleoside triphosphate hydrolase n=1 Tax=Paramecium tetraurelia TaxID=5888 RepID=A0CQ87_PARTE|nr:uncharacterized protein GSPATT00009302001 [Paramecium tetraurelia]CAK72954.1 unnamed protein product [Paramecium tetraurelia]|eukprot:XP_001440351.1 hypothetical protein (macronuclear) [Paramecium tetraurelia strain d4-2]
MDQANKLQYQQQVEKYLERNKVYSIFEDLLKSLIIKKPDDPIQFLINKLQEPETKKIFVIGPPGSKLLELSLTLAEYMNFHCVSIGDLIEKELSKKSELSQQIQDSLDKFQYVSDDIVINIALNQIQHFENEKKSYIFEGFPKTRVQGLAFQKEGIIPDAFLILEMSEEKIYQCCLKKLDTEPFSKLSNKEELARNHSLEYQLNLKQVKEIYKNQYFSVDGEKNYELEDMAQRLKYKLYNNAPTRAGRILVIGPPGSGRSTLAKHLCSRYGFVYISTRELISNLVNKKGTTGKEAFEKVNKGELVDDRIINALIKERINQTDCQLQGYVLDGYPKTEQQMESLNELNIQPTLIVIIDAVDDVVLKRLTQRRTDPISGRIYKSSDEADKEVKPRLVIAPNDKREIVQLRLKRWDDLNKLIDGTPKYASVIFKVSGDAQLNNMIESVCYHLEKMN